MSTLQKTLEAIIKADETQVISQLKIAKLLTAIKDHDLYVEFEYETFNAMVAGELDFAASTANRYVSLYAAKTRLKYSDKEFLRYMQIFGWMRLQSVLRGSDEKLGQRAIQARLAEFVRRDMQFNFSVLESEDVAAIEALLEAFGMERTPRGVRVHLSESFLALISDYQRITAECKAKKGNDQVVH